MADKFEVKIEKELIQLQGLSLTASPLGGEILIHHSKKRFQLNTLQFSYLDILAKGSMSIEGLVQFFLGQGWLVSFRELLTLLHFLIDENILQNKSFQEYLKGTAPMPPPSSSTHFSGEERITASQLPFFRSLEPSLAKHFLSRASQSQIPAQMRVIDQGARDRDLYIALKGKFAVYRNGGPLQRQMVSILGPGSLFGERGFLLGQARSADIVALENSWVLRVPHLPEYDGLIKSEKAQSLQHRFWVLQALVSSSLFSGLPSDSLDALIFSGKLYQAAAHQILFREGQIGNSCFILVQGSVVISQKGQTINVLKQGACFGEISLLMSGGVRTASVTTQLESLVLEISQNDFYRVLSQNLILAKEIEELAAQRLQRDSER